MSDAPPIHREILVEADPSTAFEVFTAGIGRWWPLTDFSVHGGDATVSFVDGKIVERSHDGELAVWGTVTRSSNTYEDSFTWHPGSAPERASHVVVTFSAAEARTLVTLVHGGWEVFDDPEAARSGYDRGWPKVLDCYREHVNQTPGAETWVALLHRPAPGVTDAGSVFEDPRFAEHVAFLSRMRAANYLVAAGPLTDQSGEGMTVLRLPGANQLDHATRLATQDDASVANGLFTVTVRPWQVVLSA